MHGTHGGLLTKMYTHVTQQLHRKTYITKLCEEKMQILSDLGTVTINVDIWHVLQFKMLLKYWKLCVHNNP